MFYLPQTELAQGRSADDQIDRLSPVVTFTSATQPRPSLWRSHS